MPTYPLKKLSEICKILKGKNPELFNDERKNSLPYLSAKFIRGTQTPEYALTSDKKSVIVDKDEIIIICDWSNSGESFIGFSGILSSTMGKMVHSKEIQNLYLKYFLDVIVDELRDKKTGTAIPHLDIKRLLNSNIPLPLLSVQEEIVAKLDSAMVSINEAKIKTEQALAVTRELWESTLEEAFRGGDGWEERKLEDEIDLILGFAFKSKGYTDKERDILLLRGDNIMQWELRWEDAKRWKKEEYNDFQKYQLEENDIVLAMDRPWVKAWLKCARLSKNDLPALLVQRTACLRNKKKLNNSFLYYIVRSREFMNHLLSVQTGSWVPHISGQQILDFSFSLPSLLEQSRIVAHLDAVRAETDRLAALYEQKLADLDELRRSVLQEAFV